MVFAKTREAAAFLSAHLTAGKEYLALAEGAPCKEPEELYDLLFHDRARNKTYVVRRTRAGVREARLICTPLASAAGRPRRIAPAAAHGPDAPDPRSARLTRLPCLRRPEIRRAGRAGGLALYAWRLRVPHPDGRSLTFRLPEELLPPELQGLAEDL